MAIKDIFTVVDVFDDTLPAARAAITLATAHAAHVTGLALAMEPMTPGYLSVPLPAEFLAGAVEEAERQAKAAAQRFEALATREGVAFEARTVTTLAGNIAPVLAQAHLSDLVVIGQEDPDRPEPMRTALIEAMLFDAGVPLMIVPRRYAGDLAVKRVVIAWDGSSNAARAVHAALPLLRTAGEVEIVIVATDRTWFGAPGQDVATFLARHGLTVTVNTINNEPGGIAATLDNYARESGADLLVMGGYGHSRLRQFFLGGTTSAMLETMSVPVVMVH